MLSQRARSLKPSPTLALNARAKEMIAQGKNVISLAVGEPDWPTVEVAKQAGIEAIKKNKTRYTPSNGILSLRKQIVEKTKDIIGLEYDPAQVTVGAGAKSVIFSALQMLCGPGDEVLIPAPYWVSYPTMAELASATPKFVTCGAVTNFKLNAKLLESALTTKTKVLILCSPSNPTGEVYSKEELSAIAEVLREHPQVYILSDDIYDHLCFSTKVSPHILQVAPDLQNRTLLINGASKTFSMTGWRVGWAIGPKDVIQAMTNYQSQVISCAAEFAQEASVVALQKAAPELEITMKMLKERRDAVYEALLKIPQLKVNLPDGAFYFWLDISNFLNKKWNGKLVENSAQFCQLLLEEGLVAAVPGIEFGVEGYLRISFVSSKEEMLEAVSRIHQFVAKLT